jgi:predicted MPP superfamily phosphohydrolase
MVRRSMSLHPQFLRHQSLIWSLACLFLALQLGVPLVQRGFGLRLVFLSWLSYLALSAVSTYFLYLIGTDALQWALKRLLFLDAASWALPVALGLTLASTSIGLIQCLWPARVRNLEIPLRGLPPSLDGFRIVQLSDLHLGPMTLTSNLRKLVEHTNGLQPDLIAITGDLADGDVAQERGDLEELGRLQAPLGVFFVTGNHEYYSGAERWLRAVRELGWQPLVNEHAMVRCGEANLAVIGLPDPASPEKPSLGKAMKGIPEGTIQLLLFHRPLGAEIASRAGIRLQLSGHVHGGQFFPWSPIVRLFFEEAVGLHRHGDLWLYASPGTGFWGPPNRFLVPPEITLIVLRSEAAMLDR